MANRLALRRQAITAAGCIFCCAALLLASGAQASIITCEMMGTGDRVMATSDWTWKAGTSDLASIPPMTCANEFLSGGYSGRLTARNGTYQGLQKIDNTEIMTFRGGTDVTGVTVARENYFVFEAGGSGEMAAGCGAEGELLNATAYNQEAGISSRIMGDRLTYQSQGAIVQADDVIPDSMASRILVSGSGSSVLSSYAMNQVGIGNTTAVGYDQEMRERIRVTGRNMSTGMTFQWSSFANQWGE